MHWRGVKLWEEALQKAKTFYSVLRPQLDKGDKHAQEVNRTDVVPLAILCTNQSFQMLDKPQDQRDLCSKIAQVLLGTYNM